MSRKILILLAAAALNTLAAAPLKSDLDPKLPRRISVVKGNKYVIDKNVKILLPPKSTRTAKFAAEELAASGISEGLVRISVGLEDPEDIIADFEQAFADLR